MFEDGRERKIHIKRMIMNFQVMNIFPLVWGLLEKLKVKPWDFMFKVNNIILLWFWWLLTWYQDHTLNLVISIEFSNVEQRSCEPQRCSKKWLKCRTKGVLCSRAPESRVLIKRRMFEGSIGLRRGSMVYFFLGQNCWRRSPTLAN